MPKMTKEEKTQMLYNAQEEEENEDGINTLPEDPQGREVVRAVAVEWLRENSESATEKLNAGAFDTTVRINYRGCVGLGAKVMDLQSGKEISDIVSIDIHSRPTGPIAATIVRYLQDEYGKLKLVVAGKDFEESQHVQYILGTEDKKGRLIPQIKNKAGELVSASEVELATQELFVQVLELTLSA